MRNGSDRKTTGSLHIIYHGYFGTLSLSSFSDYISLVLFRRRVCYCEKQIYEIISFIGVRRLEFD